MEANPASRQERGKPFVGIDAIEEDVRAIGRGLIFDGFNRWSQRIGLIALRGVQR